MQPSTPTASLPAIKRPPMTRKEARAAGLKVFAWGITCKACRTREKFIRTATCAACPARALEARKARRLADKKATTVAKARATRQANKEEAARLALLGAGCADPAAALPPPWEALEDVPGVVVGGGVGITAALLPQGGPQAPWDGPEDLEEWDGSPPWD